MAEQKSQHPAPAKLKKSSLKLLFEVLMQEGAKRSLHDTQLLHALKKLPRKSDLDFICRQLNLQRLKASEFVFQKERAKLYIILQGSVGIYHRDCTEATLDVVETLSAGMGCIHSADCFGELVEPSDRHNNTTVALSLEDTILAVLTNESYSRFGELESSELRCVEESLKEFGPFRSLEPSQLRQLAQKSILSKLASNTIVIRQGELPKALFIVRRGILKLCRNVKFAESNDNGNHINAFSYHTKTFCVKELTTGDYFPLKGLRDRLPVQHTVVSVCPCELILIPYCDVEELSSLLENQLAQLTDNQIRLQYSLDQQWQHYKSQFVSGLVPSKRRAF